MNLNDFKVLQTIIRSRKQLFKPRLSYSKPDFPFY